MGHEEVPAVTTSGQGSAAALAAIAGAFADCFLEEIEQLVVVASPDYDELDGYDAAVVLIGPQRWHPARRARAIADLRVTARTVGVEVDVYPVRPSDVIGAAADRNPVIVRWLQSGLSIHRSGQQQ
jgi:hypothetical protein